MKYFSKFMMVGLFNTAFGYLVIFSLMYLFKVSPEISNLSGYGVGLIGSYFLNRNFTFLSKKRKSIEFLRFFVVFCLAYTTNFLMLVLLIYYCGANEGLSQILSGLVYVIASFLMNKYYVFGQTQGYPVKE